MIYPVDSAIQLWNNWGQEDSSKTPSCLMVQNPVAITINLLNQVSCGPVLVENLPAYFLKLLFMVNLLDTISMIAVLSCIKLMLKDC